MERVLVVGGIHEALQLSRLLIQHGRQVHYSLAGKAGIPKDLSCNIRVGPFADSNDIANYVQQHAIQKVVDCTHPYAVEIKHKLMKWNNENSIPLCSYRRPAWKKQHKLDWQDFASVKDMIRASYDFDRIFSTLGSTGLQAIPLIKAGQYWWIRCLKRANSSINYSILYERGPFTLAHEKSFLKDRHIQLMLCKNSGGDGVFAKVQAAWQLSIPIFMLARPKLPESRISFHQIQDVADFLLRE